MSDPMSTLEARITEVIEVHKVRGWTSDGTHREMRCHPCGKTIGGAFPTIEALEKHHFAEVIAAMLAPVIAEAKVEALREASAAAYKDKRIQGLQRTIIGIWTNNRADELEQL